MPRLLSEICGKIEPTEAELSTWEWEGGALGDALESVSQDDQPAAD